MRYDKVKTKMELEAVKSRQTASNIQPSILLIVLNKDSVEKKISEDNIE